MELNNISPELIEKAKGLSPDELADLAKSEGIDLSDEQLEAVAGGVDSWRDGLKTVTCSECGGEFTMDIKLVSQRCPHCNALYLNELGN